jgi:hypothetical protein
MRGRADYLWGKFATNFLTERRTSGNPSVRPGGLCTLVQKVSRTSRYYPNGIPKSSVRLVVPSTSIVLFAKHTSGGPPVRPHYKQQRTSARPSVRLPPEG